MNLKKLKKKNIEKDTMKYCIENGFTHENNFQYNSGFPIDSNFPWLISVGNDVTLSSDVKLLAHDASTAKILDGNVHTKIGIIKIGNNVFIGANSIVLCNVRIGDNVIIGAGSIVTHDLPSNGVYAGNPARYICSFENFSNKHMDSQINHPIFRKKHWSMWKNATEKEKQEMREKLKDTYGYL